jgi:hypothetical protein
MAMPDGSLLEVPHTSQSVVPIAWHYTTVQGLLGVVQSRELWASSPLGLNDLSEMRYGVEVIAQAWRDIDLTGVGNEMTQRVVHLSALLHGHELFDGKVPIYFLCASKNPDSLNQWMHYTRAQGYALGIDTERKLAPVLSGEVDESERMAGGFLFAGWRDVEYRRDRQTAMATDLLNFFIRTMPIGGEHERESMAGYLIGLAATFKHQTFAAEEEIRFIVDSSESHGEFFRAGNSGVVPYLRLRHSAQYEGSWSHEPAALLPLVQVRCGPRAAEERDLEEASVQRLLRASGYAGVAVSHSAAPYRF